MAAVMLFQKAGRAPSLILAELIDIGPESARICGHVITGKISPSFNKGWGKAEIEAEQRGRGFGLGENPFGDFAARPDLSRRWDDVRRSIAFAARSEEHTSELQSLMRTSYAVFCLQKKKKQRKNQHDEN